MKADHELSDRVAAAQWAALAAAAGNSDARHLLKELQLFLSGAEMAEPRKRAESFKPVKEPAAMPKNRAHQNPS